LAWWRGSGLAEGAVPEGVVEGVLLGTVVVQQAVLGVVVRHERRNNVSISVIEVVIVASV